MSTEFASLRSTLKELQSCELPASYQQLDKENNINDAMSTSTSDNDNNDTTSSAANNSSTSPLLFYNPELLQQYKTLRNTYIQQATIDKFLTSLQQYDPETHTFPLPSPPTEDEREQLAQRQEQTLILVKQTISQINGDTNNVQLKWEQFVNKREELGQIVDQLERQDRNRRLDGGANDDDKDDNNMEEEEKDDGEEVTEEDVALQEEKLNELQQRKIELGNRLRSVKAQILDVEDDTHRTKRVVNEIRVKGGRKPLDWRGGGLISSSSNSSSGGGKEGANNSSEVEYISVVAEEMEAEITDMNEKAVELKKSCDFYDGIRELMEELGGVKILSSKSITSNNNNNKEEEGFVLTLMLLGSHILEITLAKSSTDKDGLCVTDAKITTPTTFAMPQANESSASANANNNEETTTLMETMHSVSLSNISFSKIMSQNKSQEVTIPPLNDLVSFSQSLESSSHGIRFILVETLARIRTLEARVVELSKLREQYAAQVYDVESSASVVEMNKYGGAEQEVVCAINEGITVALRLGADCPLIPGSVYVSEIFGVGGWEETKLNVLKDVVVKKRCRGPVGVMECIVKEIRKRSKEEGWVVPATPSLPRGK